MKKIGRIKYTTMGQYDPEVTYTEMNTVLYEGSRWEAKKETTGNAPPDNAKNDDGTLAENEFWRLFLPGALGDDYVKKTDLSRPPTETEAGTPGVNFPDGKTIQIDENGMLTGTPLDFMGTWKSLQEGIASGEIKDGMIGYIRGDSENEEDSDHPNSFLFPVDDFLSLISSNAVQNRIVTAALERLEQLENETRALRASLEQFGLAKICPLDLTDVTEDNGMVLGAVEKNASIEGTISNIFSNRLTSLINKLNTWSVLMNRVHINGGAREDIDLIDNMEKYMMVLFVFEWDISYSIMSQSIVPTSVFSSRNQHLILYSASGDVHIQFWHITGTRVGVQMTDNQYVSASILGFGKI